MTLPVSPSFPAMKPRACSRFREPKYNSKGELCNRYFRVVVPIMQLEADSYVLDREIVISAEIFIGRLVVAPSPAVSGMILVNRGVS